MGVRSWRWLQARVLSLLDRPAAVVAYGSAFEGQRLASVPSTRLGWALNPPKFE